MVRRKTAKGQTGIESRAHHLLPRLRTLPILVDGRSDEPDLRRFIPGDAGEPSGDRSRVD